MDTAYVREECRKMNEQLVAWRRRFHRIPEIGIDLPETVAAVRGIFHDLGVELQPGYQGAGVLGLIRGEAGRGVTVGIRADMDALEIQEEAGREYGSCYPGRMHACGHDAHMAMALGAASFLTGLRREFGGTVKLIFQPGEEWMDGARRMLEAGALDNPGVDMLLGLHIGGLWDELESGQLGVSHQPIMAAADSFDFIIQAPGAHGAAPHRSPDPVLAAASVIIQLHTLVGREIDPVDTAVVTVGQISGGRAPNIIPTEVSAKGTVRTLDEKVRGYLEKRIGEVVAQTAKSFRCRHEYSYCRGAPPVQSDPEIADLVAGCARDLFGAEKVKKILRPSMAGEDVSLFLEKVPGCFFALGASNPAKGINSVHHSPVFDLDESVLWQGTAVFCLAALRRLQKAG